MTFLSTRHRQTPQHEEKHEQFTPKKGREPSSSCTLVFEFWRFQWTRNKDKVQVYYVVTLPMGLSPLAGSINIKLLTYSALLINKIVLNHTAAIVCLRQAIALASFILPYRKYMRPSAANPERQLSDATKLSINFQLTKKIE